MIDIIIPIAEYAVKCYCFHRQWGFPYSVVWCGNLTIPNYVEFFHCFLFDGKVKLRHSPGRPSRSDFVQSKFVYYIYPVTTRDFAVIPICSEGATCKVDGGVCTGSISDPSSAPTINPEKSGWTTIEVTSGDGTVTNTYYLLHIGNVKRWRNMQYSYWNFIPETDAVNVADKEVLKVIKDAFEQQIQTKWNGTDEEKETILNKINDDLTKIGELEKEAAEQAIKDEAETFSKIIAALKGDGTDSDAAIAAAKAAYQALSPEAKELAKDDFAKLTAAEKAVVAKKEADKAADAVKKGDSFKIGKNNYKVTKISGKAGEVSFVNCTSNKLTKVSIPDTVNYKGYNFKVTAIQSKALKGYKKITTVTIGKNVTSIGANAFNGDAKLKKITVKSTGLKKVGAKALKGIHKKAVIKVPKKMLKKYKKIFKGKGQKKTVKIK